MSAHAALPLPNPPITVLADLWANTRARTACLVAGGTLLTAMLAQLTVPVPGSPVPITGQTLALVLVAAALGPHRALATMTLYLAAGLVGLPFYSDAASGYQVITGATGGYLIGFLPAAYLIGLAAQHKADRRWLPAAALAVTGQAVVFAVGVPWLAATANLSATAALEAGLWPFLLGGALKAALAATILTSAWHLRSRFSHAQARNPDQT